MIELMQAAAGVALALSFALLCLRRTREAVVLIAGQLVCVAVAAAALGGLAVAALVLCQAVAAPLVPLADARMTTRRLIARLVIALILAGSAVTVPGFGLPLAIVLNGVLLLAGAPVGEQGVIGVAATQSGLVLAALLTRADVRLLWLAAIPWLPALACVGVWVNRHRAFTTRLLAPAWASWSAALLCSLALAVACTLPWQIGIATSHAVLLLTALAAAASWGGIAADGVWGGRLIVLAGSLLAVVAVAPGTSWLGMLLGTGGALAILLPRRGEAWRALLLGCVGLGLALLGIVAMRATASPVAVVALAVGYGATALLAPELAIAAIVLILRRHGAASSGLLACLGLTALLIAAGSMLVRRPRQLLPWLALGQGGIVLFASGLGLGVAAELQLTLLVLALCALLLAHEGRLDRLLALAGAAGLSPAGLLPSLAMIIGATTTRSTWLLLPLGIGLAGMAWATIVALPPPRGSHSAWAPAWIPLSLLLIVGFALPEPMLAWLSLVAAGAQ